MIAAPRDKAASLLAHALWFMVFFVSTMGFGLRNNSWGGLGMPGLGWFGVMQLLVGVLSLVGMIPWLNTLFGSRISGVKGAVMAVGLIPFYLIAASMVHSISDYEVPFSDIVRNLLQFKFFIMIYLVGMLVSRPRGMEEALDALGAYALVSAVALIVILVFHVQSDATFISTSLDVTRFFRVIFPGGPLVAAGWILFFCRYLVFGKFANLLCSFVCLGSTLILLHRGTLIAVAVTTLVIVYWLITSRHLTTPRRKWTILGSFGALVLGAGTYAFATSRLLQGYILMSSNQVANRSGTMLLRQMLITNSWDYVMSTTFGLGIGLKWQEVDDFWTYRYTAFVAGPTNDSAYANIILVLGLPGVALLVWLFFSLASLSKRLRNSRDDSFAKIAGLFLGALFVFNLVGGVSGDVMLLTGGSTICGIALVLAARLEHLQRSGQLRS